MNRMKSMVAGVAAGLVLAVPQAAEAQAADGWWELALRDVAELRTGDRNVSDERQDDRTIGDIIFGRDGERNDRARTNDRTRRNDGQRGAKGNGPPFCRNGQGHPVHGQRWCRDKGFGQGSVRWEDRGWEDVIFGTPRGGDRRRGTVDQGGLIDVLGDVVLRRLSGESRRLGSDAPLEGRWIDLRDGARVLQIRSGSTPVAELSDLNGDGRVDVSLVPRK